MKHRIDPKIDCVFKALLGSETNRNLLIHFLNAILDGELRRPIAEVEILNPYNDREFLDDKLSIVDVKARDDNGGIYQVEIQLLGYRHLPARMLYTWADIYSQQLQSGQDYGLLHPTYGIWLLAENLLPDDSDYAHTYKLRDSKGRTLIEHGGIWILELEKFAADRIENEEQRWLKFFKDGGTLDDATLPDWMNTHEMRQAMTTLKTFSDKDRDYHAYQARQNFLREQRTLAMEREEALRELELERMKSASALAEKKAAVDAALAEKSAALVEKDAALSEKNAALAEKSAALAEKSAALAEKDAAMAEIERLKALLEQR